MTETVVRRMIFISGVSVLWFGGLFGPLAFAQHPRPNFDFAALERSIEESNRKLRKVQGAVDQTRFDPEDWLDRLDYDAEEILAAVTGEIAFQPYAGVLRGVAGTMRARAGNSVDQALLLAWLLKSAGYDARIVRGELSAADAGRLLGNIDAAFAPESLDYLAPAIEREFGTEAMASATAIDWSNSKLAERSARTADMLLDALEDAGIRLQPRDMTGPYVTATRDYFWVQHRSGASAAWDDAHPAFGGGEPPSDLEAVEFFAAAIPPGYQHRLTLSAHIAQRVVNEVKTHSLMSPFTASAANLDGKAFSYRNQPDGLTPATIDDIGAAIAATRILMPILNGGTAPGAMAFDLNGRVIDPMALGSGAAGLFSTLAEKLENATSNVADPADPKDILSLDSMWLEFTFTAPDETQVNIRRYILPPSGGEPRDNEQMLWALITDHSYAVNTGRHPVDYLIDRYLATGIASGAWYQALVHKYSAPDKGTVMPSDEVPQDFLPLAQFRVMDAFPYAPDGVHAFRNRPNLVGIRRGFRGPDVAFVGVDVVSNANAQVRSAGGKLSHDPVAALRRGVWDTAVEAVPVRSLSVDAVRRANAVDMLHLAIDENIDLEVLQPGQDDRLAPLNVPPAALASIRDDLDNGFAIVIPERTPAGAAMQAWWKVHPETGETLGMTADGYGQEIAEYLMDVTMTAMGLVQAIGGLKKCTEKTDMVEGLCCLVETHINNVGGLGFGGIMGATLGTTTSAVFTIVDFTMVEATEQALGEGKGLMPTAALNCDQLQMTEW